MGVGIGDLVNLLIIKVIDVGTYGALPAYRYKNIKEIDYEKNSSGGRIGGNDQCNYLRNGNSG